MTKCQSRAGAAVALALATGAGAQVYYVEGFSGGANAGAWTFGAPMEVIESSGGSPGAHLHGSGIDTTVPTLRTGQGVTSVFTGDYRDRSAQGLRVSIRVNATDFSVATFRPGAILYSENGTPGDPSDDWGVYELSGATLGPPGVWVSHAFPLNSRSTTLPAGWSFIQFGPGSPANPDWNYLIRHVDRLMFSLGDPSLFYIFQMWDVGADSIQISGMPPCYVNCDHSTTQPFLNVLDFSCFINLFASGDTHANGDASQNPPVLNVLDFACFLNNFAAGCSAP